ncbi:hypothetical protein [Pseudarthrobacter sp. S9]|uniref:hypothetical protein n=1 Tax=Pseudarthrobacter sp. S9 TaxID=3418421 RepID=UPI003D081403
MARRAWAEKKFGMSFWMDDRGVPTTCRAMFLSVSLLSATMQADSEMQRFRAADAEGAVGARQNYRAQGIA